MFSDEIAHARGLEDNDPVVAWQGVKNSGSSAGAAQTLLDLSFSEEETTAFIRESGLMSLACVADEVSLWTTEDIVAPYPRYAVLGCHLSDLVIGNESFGRPLSAHLAAHILEMKASISPVNLDALWEEICVPFSAASTVSDVVSRFVYLCSSSQPPRSDLGIKALEALSRVRIKPDLLLVQLFADCLGKDEDKVVLVQEMTKNYCRRCYWMKCSGISCEK